MWLLNHFGLPSLGRFPDLSGPAGAIHVVDGMEVKFYAASRGNSLIPHEVDLGPHGTVRRHVEDIGGFRPSVVYFLFRHEVGFRIFEKKREFARFVHENAYDAVETNVTLRSIAGTKP